MPQEMLTAQEAHTVFHNKVYAPVFFEKLAQDYNIRPTSEAEAQEMLVMAAQLRTLHDAENEKRAASRPDPMVMARNILNNQLAQHGFSKQAVASQNQHRVKQSAAAASFDSELAHAALSVLAQHNAA